MVFYEPNSREFINYLQNIPADQHNQIYSIRKVDVLSQNKKFEDFKQNNEHSGIIQVFHGTPSTSNATSIAYGGFNLNIITHGRALGNGVYSSTNFNITKGYAQSGSVIYMNGILTDKTIKNGEVYVFPQPEQVLPQLIYDYSQCPQEDYKKYKRILSLYKEEDENTHTKMKEEFGRYRENYVRTWKKEYEKMLLKVHSLMENDKTMSPEEETKLSNSILLEFKQMTNHLPILIEKDKILDSIQHNRVIFIESDTGSGKSTIIPQWLLDNFYIEGKKICILEPKRVNAQCLATYVSGQRSSQLGDEIGLLMGQGVKIVSSNTKLTYMTHGYFISIMQSQPSLIKDYSFIVVDESHEKSVDVELSLSIVKKLLLEDSNFKVIVASATMGNHSEFRSLLIPSEITFSSIQISGKCFPVFDVYRPINLENDVIEVKDIIGNTNAISSYAVQTAFDLIERTSLGNVLVFLPGLQQIKAALKSAKSFDMDNIESDFEFQVIGNYKKKRIVFSGFHGSMSNEEKAIVQNSINKESRCVIFSTNVAETGLTFPGIRYVIDSGIENVMKWDPNHDLLRMETRFISKASMKQRAGRAGRVASGICVRLYSKEQANLFEEEYSNAMETGDITMAILQQVADPKLSFIHQVDQARKDQIINRLQTKQLVDRSLKITQPGKICLLFGGIIQCGLFVCSAMQRNIPIESICIIASMFQNTTLAENLIRDFSKSNKGHPLINQYSDHITFYNLFHYLMENHSTQKLLTFSINPDDYELLNQMYNENLVRFQQLEYESQNFQYNENYLLQSIIESHFDKSVSLIQTGKPYAGTSPNIMNGIEINQNPISFKISNKSAIADAVEASKSVLIYSYSMHKINDQFGKCSLVTLITGDEYINNAPKGTKPDTIQMIKKKISKTITIDITPDDRKNLLDQRGQFLQKLEAKHRVKIHFPSDPNKKDKLLITGPSHTIDQQVQSISREMQTLKPESFEIPLTLKTINRGKAISMCNKLRDELRQIAAERYGSSETNSIRDIKFSNDDQPNITVTVSGKAKSMYSIIYAMIYNEFSEYIQPSNRLNDPRIIERLVQICTEKPHQTKDPMLIAAHTLIWNCGCSIYGGFVRDWVILNQNAHDIDALVDEKSVSQVQSQMANELSKLGFRCYPPTKGKVALKTQVQYQGVQFCIDLVSKKDSITNQFYPFVDCNVGNLIISAKIPGYIGKKIPEAGGSFVPLSKCIAHCQKKKFIFFNIPGNKYRLEKYFQRGWTCISTLTKEFDPISNKYPSFYKPKPKYSALDWSKV